jgi:hypothetical protein
MAFTNIRQNWSGDPKTWEKMRRRNRDDDDNDWDDDDPDDDDDDQDDDDNGTTPRGNALSGFGAGLSMFSPLQQPLIDFLAKYGVQTQPAPMDGVYDIFGLQGTTYNPSQATQRGIFWT